jgi:hypothetical protein
MRKPARGFDAAAVAAWSDACQAGRWHCEVRVAKWAQANLPKAVGRCADMQNAIKRNNPAGVALSTVIIVA